MNGTTTSSAPTTQSSNDFWTNVVNQAFGTTNQYLATRSTSNSTVGYNGNPTTVAATPTAVNWTKDLLIGAMVLFAGYFILKMFNHK